MNIVLSIYGLLLGLTLAWFAVWLQFAYPFAQVSLKPFFGWLAAGVVFGFISIFGFFYYLALGWKE